MDKCTCKDPDIWFSRSEPMGYYCGTCGKEAPSDMEILHRFAEESHETLKMAKATLESVKDRMDEFAYQELSSALNP